VIAGDGTVWLGTIFGLSILNAGGTSTNLTTDDGLPNSRVTTLAFADGDVLWIGTNGGLSSLDDGDWTSYTAADGLPSDWINSVAVAPDGAVWVATREGLARFDRGV